MYIGDSTLFQFLVELFTKVMVSSASSASNMIAEVPVLTCNRCLNHLISSKHMKDSCLHIILRKIACI